MDQTWNTSEYTGCSFVMSVAVCWDKAYEEPWVLMTTHSNLRKAIQTYGNRSGIEPMHKDWKSNAFDIEGTRVTHAKRIETLLIPMALCYTDRHEISEDFRETYIDWPPGSELADIAATTESIGFRTEYPLFGRRDLPIWIPSEQYSEADARDFLQKATQVFGVVEEYLESEHNGVASKIQNQITARKREMPS